MNQLLDNIREVFYYLRQYKGRTFMTMFGIIWGTMTIVLLLAFGVGVEKSMKKNMHGMGESIAIMWPGRTSKVFQGYNKERRIRLRAEDVELMRNEVGEFSAISPEFIKYGVPVRHGDKINQATIAGMLPEYGAMRNVLPRPGGRWLNDMDLKEKRRVCFIGYKLRDLLYGENASVIGKYLMVGDIPFRIIGVLQEKTQPSSYSSRDHDRVFMPMTTFQSIYGYVYVSNVVYQVADPRRNKIAEDKIYKVLGKKLKFDPTDKQALGIWDTTEQDKFIYYFSLGFKIFLGIIGTITLIVGGIGLANIMYVVVQERTREIGIKRSIGAKSKQIMGQFLFESFMIIGMSAAIGLALAVVLIKLISKLPIEEYVGHPELSWSVAIASTAVLGLIGFLAGYFPARKASRLDVIECLRY